MFTSDLPIPELLAAARRPEVVAAMEAFYAETDRLIASKGPTCWNRGLCCRFGEYGHRLYVTALEVVYYLARTPPSEAGAHLFGVVLAKPEATGHPSEPEARGRVTPPNPRDRIFAIEADVCPHALTGICHARDRRPLGCRIFYCDPAAQAWQGPLTEELLSDLRDLHERFEVPYFYADWMSVLRALSKAGAVRFGTPS